MKIKPMICTQCGAPINRERMMCEYCGTKYDVRDDPILRIETYQEPIVTLESVCGIDKRVVDSIGPDKASAIICGKMAVEMADKLTALIDLKVQEDPYLNTIIAHGRVRAGAVFRRGYEGGRRTKLDNAPKTEILRRQILVLKVKAFLKQSEKEEIKRSVLEQMKDGIVILPTGVEVFAIDAAHKWGGKKNDAGTNRD